MIKSCFIAILLCLSSVVCAQQTIVLPAISNSVEGLNGSIWATELLIIKANPSDQITIRRLWVCLEGGGFADDPESAPKWEMNRTEPWGRALSLGGAQLLSGTEASLGAVGLVVEGGQVIANARVADISSGTTLYRTPFGQGQLIPTESEPLVGPAHLPWLGGCLRRPCNNPVPTYSDPPLWNPYRNNIGLINPNPTAHQISGVVLAFGQGDGPLGPAAELGTEGVEPESFTKRLPPFGWTQFHWVSDRDYGVNLWISRLPQAGFLISLTPDSDLPYYAYASVIFSPDPNSDIPAFNDPLFIPAKPGFVAPYDWMAQAP